MADLRVTGGASPNALQPARPSAAVREAQRAFFTAALNEAAPSQPARPVQAQTVSRGATAQASPSTTADQPSRFARPGSLLDIKV
jgi:hypothetical protein